MPLPASQNPVIAIVQEAPVFLNLAASVAKAETLIRQAAENGANIITFAECWLPGYPVWLDFAPNAAIWDHAGAKALFRLLYDNAVTKGDAHLAALQTCADETGCFIVMGTHERVGNTLYNSSFTFTPGAGQPVVHRKLVPTYSERLVWGRGDGSTLASVDTPWGVLGNLICWEHWMPLARAAMHAKRESIHVAQWPAVRDVHQVASRHYAFEGRCYVAAAGSILTKGDVMAGLASLGGSEPDAEAMLADMPGGEDDYIHPGGSALIGPEGDYICKPLFEQTGTLMAEADMQTLKEACQQLDTDGHYSRPDVFELSVNTRPMPGVTFDQG